MKQPKLKIGDKYRVIKTNKIITVEEIFNRHSFYGSDNNWHNLELGELQLIKPKTKKVKKYKYTRKEIIKKYLHTKWRYYFQLADDLLAKQEDKKECKHGWQSDIDTFDEKGLKKKHCMICNKVKFERVEPTPSPLDLTEDIEEMKTSKMMSFDSTEYCIAMQNRKTINSLIRNQTKIINYLKGKKYE